jgi:RimJ/RimL family protein N-acetyltransferase
MASVLKQNNGGNNMEGTIHLIPYLKNDTVETFSDVELMALYDRILRESLDDVLFYDGTIETRDEFVEYMKSDKTVFVCAFRVHGESCEPAGVLWVNQFEKYTAQGHFVFFKEFWGTGWPQKIGRLFCKEITSRMYPTLIGVVPTFNKAANHFCKEIGMHKVGTIPNMVYSKKLDKPIDATIHYIAQGDFENEDL